MPRPNQAPRPEVLSDVQRQFTETVDRLSVDTDGPRGIERYGIYPAFPGVSLLSYITDLSEDKRGKLCYCIEICIDPIEMAGALEQLWVDTEVGRTTYQAAEGCEPFGPDVPDEVIESFLKRYNLTNE